VNQDSIRPDGQRSSVDPEWLLFEGRFYRLSDDPPSSPPWTHVERRPAEPESRKFSERIRSGLPYG
jgi:hypothetical protein